MGSVKKTIVQKEANEGVLGIGSFVFSDSYSIFDWGRMPDEIPNKGASICFMGAHNFELLERKGIETHYRGVVENGEVIEIKDASFPPREMAIDIARVPELNYTYGKYDYRKYYENAEENYVIPLEIIFRNTIPIGSSLRGRMSPEECGIDLENWPDKDIQLKSPMVEFSTKYEDQDRYLQQEAAEEIARGEKNIKEMTGIALEVNDIISKKSEKSNMIHHDGKIECICSNGRIIVGDIVGTLDENRFTYKGRAISKEILRQYYINKYSEWVKLVLEAKKNGEKNEIDNWRNEMKMDPPKIPDNVIKTVSDMYSSAANAYTNISMFDSPDLDKVIKDIKLIE